VAGLVPEARSHLFLLDAVRRLPDQEQTRIEVHLAGASSATRADEQVVHHGYLSHAAALALLRSADLLFLPMHDLEPGTRSRTVPGKTYEYLASGVPILAALPDGDARDLLSGASDVWLCRPRDVDCMTEAVASALRSSGRSPTRRPIADRFERRKLAAQLAQVFETVTDTTSHQPRGAGAPIAPA
jgi:glycosyltransferase involved in cell wall biosynthesis